MDRSPLVAELGLAPHPEGGWYRETWAADPSVRPPGYPGARPTATAIYFLLHPEEESRWHTVRSAELWLWHAGGPLALRTAGSSEQPGAEIDERILGPDVVSGQRPQLVVPAGVWQSAVPFDEPVLVTCVVSPGFDMADFRMI